MKSPSSKPPSSAHEPPSSAAPPVKRARILVVDHDPKVTAALERMLRRDYDVVAETASRAALEHLQKGERFDAIVTDLAMPNVSVPALHAAIRELDAAQADRMLFITGGVATEEVELFLRVGRHTPLLKPFEVATLRQRVAELVAGGDRADRVARDADLDSATRDALFRAFAARFDVPALEKDQSSVAFITNGGAIVWVNAAWRAFGAENKADPQSIGPGRNYFDSISGELRAWLFRNAETSFASGQVFEVDYDCSSPTLKRDFRMRVLPVPELGLLVSHTLRFGPAEHDDTSASVTIDAYRTGDGIIVMCSNCRRVRRNDGAAWDWIPSWLGDAPAPVSHGLCALCLDFYYR